jgi:L-threonylcarbamoyladenylate synthase
MQGDQKKTINIEENPDLALMLAVELFHSGKVFIYPTDTIYGLGGNPLDDLVVKRINEIKGRDEKKHFIWLLSDIEKVLNYAEIVNENHLEFLQKIWPAPVTVILNLNERTKKVAKQETAAIRIPQNDFCLKLLKEISRPLISTSVNRSGNDPINQIEKIINDFSQDVEAIFFSSQAQGNVYSTIIDLTSEQPKLIREGSIKFVELLQNFT